MRTFCFTGHRPDKIGNYHENAPVVIEVKQWMKKHIIRIIEEYQDVTFITGGALGVDTWAFDIIYGIKCDPKYRSSKYKIHLHLYLPCVEHYTKWPEHAQRKIKMQIDHHADHVVWVSPERYKGGFQMQKRNIAMVDVSDGVLAVWNKTEGGTANCVKYAKKKKVPVLGYNPETQKQFRVV